MTVARTYRIGPLAVELRLPEGPLEAAVDVAWGAFRGVPPSGAVKLEVQLRDGVPAAHPRLMPRPVALPGGERLLAGEDWQARISSDGQNVVVEQKDERLPLETTVKVLLARALSQNGGMLLHGAAVAHGGGSAVFVAKSGGGKSTLSRFATLGGVATLADELVAVFPISGEWWAYGTPWNVGAAWGAPLRAIGLLSWGPSPQVDKLAPTELLKVLAENTLLPDDEADTRKALFTAAEQMLAKVKSVRLTFAPDARVASTLATLCGGSLPA